MAKKRKINRKNNYELGGIDPASLALSLGTTVAANIKASNDIKGVNSFNKSEAFTKQSEIDKDFLKQFNTSGNNNQFFYKKGGNYKNNVRTLGNNKNFKPIDDNVFVVKGASHENGGVKLNRNAEVEGGEVIKVTPQGTKILSDDTDFYGYSPADRVKSNPISFNAEFNKQELKKGGKVTNNKKYATGGIDTEPDVDTNIDADTRDKKAQDILNKNNSNFNPANFIDNAGNLLLSLNTPDVPDPVLEPKARFKTDYNVSPQLNNILSDERRTIQGINQNLADSNVATALSTKVGNQATTAKNSVLANKENIETQLYNQGVSQNIGIGARNADTLNRNADTNLQRVLGIQSGLSANLGNLARDVIHEQDSKRQAKVDEQKLKLEIFKDTEGALARTIAGSDIYDDYILKNYRQILNNNTYDQKTLDAITSRYNQLTQ